MPRTVRDVVFVDGVRTPFGKAGGVYANTRADDLVIRCIRELLRRNPHLPPERVDEVAIAATAQTGDQGMTIGRTAALLAGLPSSVPGYAIDRMCAGAMTAVTNVASAIAIGAYDVAVSAPPIDDFPNATEWGIASPIPINNNTGIGQVGGCRIQAHELRAHRAARDLKDRHRSTAHDYSPLSARVIWPIRPFRKERVD